MNLAYSLTFGEVVPAANADYADCAKHQITCPVCREAVFKGMRRVPKEVHYFSHYRAAPDAEQCELRVADMAKACCVVDGIQSHGQTLAVFLASFRHRITEGCLLATRQDIKRSVESIYARPFMQDMTPAIDGICDSVVSGRITREELAAVTASMPALSARSPFWHRRSAAYIIDVCQHLQTSQAKNNRRFLLAASMAVWPTARLNFGTDGDDLADFTRVLDAIAAGKSASAIQHLAASFPKSTHDAGYAAGVADAEKRANEIIEQAKEAKDQRAIALERVKQLNSQMTQVKKSLSETTKKMTVLRLELHLMRPIIGLLAAAFIPAS